MLVATIDYQEPDGTGGWYARPQRRPIGHPSTVRDSQAQPHDVVVEDLSASGCSFLGSTTLAVGSPVRVGLRGAGVTDARIVWRHENRYGCAFLQPLPPHQLAEAFGAAQPVTPLPGTRFDHPIDTDAHPIWPGAVRLATLVGLGSAAWVVVAAAVYVAIG